MLIKSKREYISDLQLDYQSGITSVGRTNRNITRDKDLALSRNILPKSDTPHILRHASNTKHVCSYGRFAPIYFTHSYRDLRPFHLTLNYLPVSHDFSGSPLHTAL